MEKIRSSDDLSLLQHLLCRCSFPIKYIKYDIMVNKIKIKYIYIYNVCVCVWERRCGKTVKIAPVILLSAMIILLC